MNMYTGETQKNVNIMQKLINFSNST